MAISKDKRRVVVYMPRHIYAAIKEASQTIGQSASQFIVQASAQRLRNWEDPITGEKFVRRAHQQGRLRGSLEPDTRGWVCMHPACPTEASECQRPAKHQQADLWQHTDYPISWQLFVERGYEHDEHARRQWMDHQVNVYTGQVASDEEDS